MAIIVTSLIILGLVCIYFLIRAELRQRKHKKLLNAFFLPEWEEILSANIELYRCLPKELKEQLHGEINIFLDEKRFEGCGGLEITDEIRVTIAAQACILLLNRKTHRYPKLKTILVYPKAFVRENTIHRDGQVFVEKSVCSGESWTNGPVVLSWDHVKHGASDMTDGKNVVFHEFTHQLDQEDGRHEGFPVFEERSSYVTWGRVLGQEYEKLREKSRLKRNAVMDHYGAEHPAEFFAVATETFYEKPKQMQESMPELYEELKKYYNMDPKEWLQYAKDISMRGLS